MINLNFKIANPWSNYFKSIRIWSGGTPIRYKYWEFQVMRTNTLISANLNISHRRDHAGINLNIGLFGFEVECNLYDNRHWDYKRNKWHHY